jgi:hypothetical protein
MIAQTSIAQAPYSASYPEPSATVYEISFTWTADTSTTLTNWPDIVGSVSTSISFSGDVIEAVTGTFELSINTSSSFTGLSGGVGLIDFSATSFTDFTGIPGNAGTLTASISSQTALEAVSGASGYFAFNLTTESLLEEGGASGSIFFTLDSDTYLSATEDAVGSIIFDVLSEVSLSGFGVPLSQEVSVVCLNTKTLGVSSYTSYPFNSFFTVKGRNFGCSDDGVYELVGELDDTNTIATSVIATATSDFGTQKLKGVSDCYVYVRTEGDCQFRLITNEQVDRDGYMIYNNYVEGLHRRRVKVAKGIKGTTWQLEFKNDSGSDFELKQIDLIPTTFTRSI